MAYTDNTAVKTYLGITGTDDDSLLNDLIAHAKAAIDIYTSRTFEAAANTTRYFTVGYDTHNDTLYLDEDLCYINAIITDADGTSPVTLTSTEYVTMPRNTTPYYAIRLLSSSTNSWTYTDDPENGITVSGKWSYSANAPYDIVQACIRQASYFYRQKDSLVFDVIAIPDAGVIQVPKGMPEDVKVLLMPYRKVI